MNETNRLSTGTSPTVLGLIVALMLGFVTGCGAPIEASQGATDPGNRPAPLAPAAYGEPELAHADVTITRAETSGEYRVLVGGEPTAATMLVSEPDADGNVLCWGFTASSQFMLRATPTTDAAGQWTLHGSIRIELGAGLRTAPVDSFTLGPTSCATRASRRRSFALTRRGWLNRLTWWVAAHGWVAARRVARARALAGLCEASAPSGRPAGTARTGHSNAPRGAPQGFGAHRFHDGRAATTFRTPRRGRRLAQTGESAGTRDAPGGNPPVGGNPPRQPVQPTPDDSRRTSDD